MRLFIFRVKQLVMEVDAWYIKGMINNPDLQPNTAINCWIAGILLFDFEILHVPANKHTAPDGLSRRPPAPDDPPWDDDHEDWVDEYGAFAIELINRQAPWDSPRSVSPFSPSLALPHNNSADAAPSTGVYTAAMTDPPLPQVEPLIPRSNKAQAADSCLDQVHKFLLSEHRPAKLDDGGFEALIRFATRFFLREGNLWRRECSG